MLGVWTLLLVAALPLAPQVFRVLEPGGFTSPRLEVHRVDDLVAQHFGYNPSSLVVIFRSPTPPGVGELLRNDDPRFLSEIDRALERVRLLDAVAGVSTPRENPRQASSDGRTAFAVVALRDLPQAYREVLPKIEAALQQTTLQQFITGAPVFYDDIQAVTERDLRRAEVISLPFAALALL
ncbi:MAG: family transporter, partial [Chloroflexi bacterium]|nr:family transporter [Chloroflexota bacterium]